ncbi:MAG: hypothetical protein ACRENS_02525, partial [Candidatus Eiseniibacteriota bacterium]
SSLIAASVDVDSTINSLLAETDDQSDDVIKISPDPVARAQLASKHDQLTKFRLAMNGPYNSVGDWDQDAGTPSTPLTVDVSRFFTHPVQDWKALMPSYTVDTEKRSLGNLYQYDSGSDPADVTVGTEGYYSADASVQAYFNGTTLDTLYSSYGDPGLTSVMTPLVRQHFDELALKTNWTGEGYVSMYFGGTLPAGTSHAVLTWYRTWNASTGNVFIPVVIWDASDFGSWTWPDPTLNGMVPDLHTTPELLNTFGITASEWRQRNVLDWTTYRY